jgi:hypothetical protein
MRGCKGWHHNMALVFTLKERITGSRVAGFIVLSIPATVTSTSGITYPFT